MRGPPEKPRGPQGWHPWGLAKRNNPNQTGTFSNSKPPLANQAVTLTAIPLDAKWWRLKAVSPDGESVVLPGLFRDRLQALGAGVMLAQRCGGRVRP